MSTSPHDPADPSGPDRPEGSNAPAAHLDPWDPDLLDRLGVHVPTDARALDADRRRLLGLGRRLSWPASMSGRPVMGLVTTVAIAIAAFVLSASLGSVISPQATSPPPSSYALAPNPGASPGLVGGLVPESLVRVDETPAVSSRDLRPGVLFVPPTTACADCAAALDNIWKQAAEYGLAVYLLVPGGGSGTASALLRGTIRAHPAVVVDAPGALVGAYGADVAQAVLIHADGVVSGVVRAPAVDARLEQLLSPLRFPGAPPSLRSAADPA